MKKFLHISIIFFTIVFFNSAYSQSNIKTWTETTVQDFNDSHFNNLIVTSSSNGEVQLKNPLQKTMDDYLNNSLPRYVSTDSIGNFITVWKEDGILYVRKYSSNGEALTLPIQVNETKPNLAEPYFSQCALFNDGTFLVVWTAKNQNYPGTRLSLFGQIFNYDSIKIGNNLEIMAHSESNISIVANESEGLFWLMYTEAKIPGSDKKIYVQKLNKGGNLVGTAFQLNPDLEIGESSLAVVSKKNEITVAFFGINNRKSNLYYRKYFPDGNPKGSEIKVNDEIGQPAQYFDLCYDDQNNLLIAWSDSRNTGETFTIRNIYGQLFDSTDVKAGVNVRLENSTFNSNLYPDIEFKENEFQISWLAYDNNVYRCYLNRWTLEQQNFGEMISSAHFVGTEGADLEKIFWETEQNQQTQIKFQIRSAKTIEQLNGSLWYGPSDLSDFYQNNIGGKINPVHNGDNYIQYKALFYSERLASPVLNSVTINYVTLDSIPPLPPQNFTAVSKHSQLLLSWEPNVEKDLLEYIIYRGTESKKYDSNWKMVIPNVTTSIEDTTAQAGTKYYYVITAVDSSQNQSLYSNETSGVAFGINIYVKQSSSPGGDGSIDNPFQTIQKGIDAAINGDTIRVLPGNYDESFNMKYGVSLVGSNPDECKINTLISAADNCAIKGFTITKTITCFYASPVITGNVIRGSSEPYSIAIRLLEFASPIITKNFITEWGLGIQIGVESNPIVKNNIIKTNEVGMQIIVSSKPTLINNTIITKRLSPVQMTPLDTLSIENNIFVTLDEYAFVNFAANAPEFQKILYNNFWNSYQAGTSVRPTNLFLDPKFVNMELQDFHLLPSSPCIDAGNPGAAYNDIDGSRNDMGAYGGPDPIKTELSSQLTKSITVSSLSGFPGDTVSAYVSLDITAGLAKADFVIEYDNSLLSLLNAGLTEATNNFSLNYNVLSNNEINVSLTSGSIIQADINEILKLNFIVNKTAKTDDASPLIFRDVLMFDINLKDINLRKITNGVFIVNFIGEGENYIYVDSKNSGTKDGSRKYPFSKIMEAVNAAETGDSIFVLGGYYKENIIMKDSIYLLGSGPNVTTIVPNDFDFSSAVNFYNVSNAEISGFNIKHEAYSPINTLIECIRSSPVIKKNCFESEAFNDVAIVCSNNSNAIIEGNYIKKMTIMVNLSNPVIKDNVMEGEMAAAVSAGMNSNPLIIRNTLFASPRGEAVYISGGSAVIRNNLIYCVDAGRGLFISGADSVNISNNIIKDESTSGSGILIKNSTNSTIINNSIITHQKGIEEQNSSSTALNNIVISNAQYGVQFSPSSFYNYNDVWNNIVNYNEIQPGINDISLNPLFVDTVKNDFKLSLNSPCLDAGNPDAVYNDIDGSRNDIGAYGGPFADLNWAANSSSLSINQITESPSDTIEVIVNGDNMNGIAGVDLTISYDPSLLKIVNAGYSDLTRNFSISRTNLEDGSLSLLLNGNKGISNDSGKLIKLYFAVQTNHTINTVIKFDSAKVKDEATFEKKVFNLKDGNIQITPTGIGQIETLPGNFALYQNYPNPFNPSTKIKYELPKESKVQLVIYNLLGEKVEELVSSFQKAGKYEVAWYAKNLSSGIYFYKLTAGEFISTRKMILIK